MLIQKVRDIEYTKSINAEEFLELLNQTFSSLLTTAVEFFEEKSTSFGYNLETYFRDGTKPGGHWKKTYYVIIELDDRVSLDVICDYDHEQKELKNFTFRSTLPRHINWKSDYFDKISLTDEERFMFTEKEESFVKELGKLGLFVSVLDSEFNPETDLLPESLVDILPRKKNFLGFANDTKDLKKFFEIYYKYVDDMRKSFEPYEDKAR